MSVPSTVNDTGFWGFYREYARSGIHAATAAGLTLFGTLSGLFATYRPVLIVVAIAVYVLPIAHFYLAAARNGSGSNTEGAGQSTPDREPTVGTDGSRPRSDNGAETRGETTAENEAGSRIESSNAPVADTTEHTATAGDQSGSEVGSDSSDPTPGNEPEPEPESERPDPTVESGTPTTDIGTNTDGSTADRSGTDEGNAVRADVDASEGTRSSASGSTNAPGNAEGAEATDTTDRTDEPRSGVDESHPDREANDRRGVAFAASESPTEEPLYDTVMGTVPFAVGEDGTALARRDGRWEVVLERGPTTESNPLWGVDATGDGERVWFCGDSGVVGRYDISETRFTDHSAPNDLTSTWEDVAVAGPAGEERVFLVNGSGAVLRGATDGDTVEWGDTDEPGSGSSIASIEFVDRDRGYCCDTNESVFETTDGGDSWNRIGIDEAGVDLNDLALVGEELAAAGDDGSVFRYDEPGWTKLYAGEEALLGIDSGSENSAEKPKNGVAVGESGVVYEFIDNDWEALDSPTEETLRGVAIGSERGELAFDVVVGDSGTILERGG